MSKVSNVRRGPALAPVPSPAAEIIRAANEPFEVTDSRGRKLMVRKPNALTKLRMFKAMGAENSKNQMYMGFAMLAASVISIDGQPMDPCLNERHIESLVSELGDEGIEAVAAAFDDSEEQDDQEALASARNFTGTPTSAT